MDVRFREVDPFNCWVWLRFSEIPSEGERNYVDGIFDSWYVIGRLGGFNAENLQVHEEAEDLSFMRYDNDDASSAMPALMPVPEYLLVNAVYVVPDKVVFAPLT